MTFEDFDVEIQDERDSDPEAFTGSVATAGVPVTITPTNGKPIQEAFIECNSTRDPDNSNNINDAIKYSFDGGTNYLTLMAGESIPLSGIFLNLKIDANNNGVNYQVIVWS